MNSRAIYDSNPAIIRRCSGVFYCWLWTYFTFFSSVSIVDFEQVDDSWEEALWNMLWYETDFYMDVESDKRKIDESFKQPM